MGMTYKDLQPIRYEEVFKVWNVMLVTMGLHGLAHSCNFPFENVREVLMKYAYTFADNLENICIVQHTVQVLTVWSNMTFNTQMDGEGCWEDGSFRVSVWLEPDQVMPKSKMVPRSPESLRVKLRGEIEGKEHLKDHLLKELASAREQLFVLHGYALCDSPQIAARFVHCESLLDDVHTVLTTL